ncbi:hypothetical protein E4U36_000148, partial [Claviceps purpurea]
MAHGSPMTTSHEASQEPVPRRVLDRVRTQSQDSDRMPWCAAMHRILARLGTNFVDDAQALDFRAVPR